MNNFFSYSLSFVYCPLKKRRIGERVFFLIGFIFFSSFILAQEKKQEFEEVTVEQHTIRRLAPEQSLNRKEIEQLSPQDLGHLLQHVAGATVRNYGGLGGMKTLSMRGLGGEHTQLIINGLPQVNAQNGQTDFGLIQIDNIEEVTLSQGNQKAHLLPVSAQVTGSTLSLQTVENSFNGVGTQARAAGTIGSFGQQEVFGTVKKTAKKGFISSSLKYRQAEGDYPYRISMGTTTHENIRRNNSFQEHLITLGGGLKWIDSVSHQRHLLKFHAQKDGADKELPGAVILYNDLADETLLTDHLLGGTTYQFFSEKTKVQAFANYNRHFLHYHDPSFLNAQGYLDNTYTNNSYNVGISAVKTWSSWELNGGTDIKYNDMTTNRTSLGQPHRLTNNSALGTSWKNSFIEFNGTLFYQYFEDDNRSLTHTNNYQRINPHVSLSTREGFSKQFQLYVWHKQSMRAPTFNELYYSQIGTLNLIPEDAIQNSFGATWNKRYKKTTFALRGNLYYNQITNKILALPTKNLFVWSIMNIGAVEVRGSDLQLNLAHEFNQNLTVTWSNTFTYQQVMDVTSSTSPTYRHQLAYTPRSTGTSTLSMYYKSWALHTTAFHVGERYSLNQNIEANRLAPFTLFDATIAHQFSYNNHTLQLQVGVRNLFDESYTFIRHFVMPGRNYFLKLTYELH